jgi:hypothetical protein
MRYEVKGKEWVWRRLRNVAVRFRTWAFAWPGVPP